MTPVLLRVQQYVVLFPHDYWRNPWIKDLLSSSLSLNDSLPFSQLTLTEIKYTFCTSSFIQKVYSKSILFVYFHHDSITPWSILFVYSKYTLSRHNFGKINRPEGIQKVYMVKYTKSIQNTTSALKKKKVYFLYTTSSLQKKQYTFCIQT